MKETWVIKIGSSLVTRSTTGLNIKNIKSWASQINEIRKKNINVIIVSSGAIAEGIGRLGLIRRPTSSSKLQALAAIGQMGLVQAYEVAFKKYNISTETGGLSDTINSNEIFVEESNNGRLMIINKNGDQIWHYLNKDKNNISYIVSRSRYIQKNNLSSIIEKLKNNKC